MDNTLKCNQDLVTRIYIQIYSVYSVYYTQGYSDLSRIISFVMGTFVLNWTINHYNGGSLSGQISRQFERYWWYEC